MVQHQALDPESRSSACSQERRTASLVRSNSFIASVFFADPQPGAQCGS